ncbi:glycoside hydrolase family 15 protein [Pedococcus bigeumensis]|uniref:glycoside hydrolase family 15 protein n=1 Tax=Pedococcus bigeumensis TaxID=433644 RepID=UPI002FEA791D
MVTSIAAVFPPHVLREYALLADGERGALVGPRGDIAWMCAPRWHDDAVFASLLGVESVYGVAPRDDRYVWGGRYEDGSLIWRGRWVTLDGIIECRDSLAFPGHEQRAVILRRIQAVSGPARVRVVLAPRAGFGRFGLSRLAKRDDLWTGRCGPLHLRWIGAGNAEAQDRGTLQLDVDLPAGAHHDLVLELSPSSWEEPPGDPDVLWERTEHAWTSAVPPMDHTVADDDARRSVAVLRGMTSTSGAMVAAATMSLPERAREGRSYDYRYAWIRDQCYAGQAAAVGGAPLLLDAAVRFVTERVLADGPQLSPAYTVLGTAVPDERNLDLPGYPGGRSIAGNWVTEQFQLDNFGEVLLLFAAAAGQDRLDLDHWKAVEQAVAAVQSRWQEPDSGIWELDPQRWTHSRLMCAAGLRAIGAHAPAAQAARWSALADDVVADVNRDCLHPSGRWQRSPEDERVDAALLLPGLRGALPAADPRTLATVQAIRRELGRSGYVYRFRQESRPLGEAEGAFLLCGFHMAMAVHEEGKPTEAARWFERSRAACGAPGLFSEEYDVAQRQLRGNYPQAFVHALLLESAQRLAGPAARGSVHGSQT